MNTIRITGVIGILRRCNDGLSRRAELCFEPLIWIGRFCRDGMCGLFTIHELPPELVDLNDTLAPYRKALAEDRRGLVRNLPYGDAILRNIHMPILDSSPNRQGTPLLAVVQERYEI